MVRANGAAQRQLMVQVPTNVVPGETQLGVNVGASGDQKRLLVTVPHGANPGDALVLTEDDSCWNIGILPADAFKEYLRESAQSESTPSPESDAQADGAEAEAEPSENLGGSINLSLQPNLRSRRMTIGRLRVNVNVQGTFERLTAAVNAAGGHVNPKVERKAIPPSGMIGLVATESIDKGEVIARIPARMHISYPTAEPAMPELFAAVKALGVCKDTVVGVCTTSLLGEALRRIETRHVAVADGSVAAVWAAYCEVLLGEKFDSHGYQRWIMDEAKLRADLSPSPEAFFVKCSASDLLRTFALIEKRVPADVLGPFFRAGIFLQARLCMLSRVFHACAEWSSLVPVVDLMNHAVHPTVDWVFDPENGDMVTTANRRHEAGEQLWITYGLWPNPLLQRVYGFTLPPEMEPSWAVVLSWTKPWAGFEKYLPEGERLIHLDTRLLQANFVEALNICASRGCDAKEFLLKICLHCRSEYEHDELLQPALAALRTVRAKTLCSAEWWTELDFEGNAWLENCLRVKMSEYLCLTSHIEAIEVSSGAKAETDCFAHTASFRAVLIEGLNQLEQSGHLIIKTENVTM